MQWLKYGCLGCLGLVGLFVLLIGGVTGTAWLKARSEAPEDRSLSHAVPQASAAAEQRPASRSAPGASWQDLGSATGAEGKVVLDLSNAEFEIEPGAPGEPLRVEASYDTNSYRLDEHFEAGDGSGWTYRLEFRGSGIGIVTFVKEIFSKSRPNVRVILPVDAPIELELHLNRGGARAELGGLWLTSADLTIDKGGLDLDFGEPLRGPMERLWIDVEMGGASVQSVGNASPHRLKVACSMGGMEVDLRGRWLNDAEIEVSSRMGGGVVRLPRDGVNLEGLASGRIGRQDDSEIPRPTLRFLAISEMGDLEFID